MLSFRRHTHIFSAKISEEFDISTEVVILLIFGVFMSLFGLLLFRIQAGELPYNRDSMYGLFLFLVSIQTITIGKTPFGDLCRSWILILIGISTAVIGMIACFIPGPLTEPIRILVGLLLAPGGAALLFQLFASKEKAKTWMNAPGLLRQMTLAAGLVYVLSVISGLVTLLPGIIANSHTAVLLIIYGISFFYLAWIVREVRGRYPTQLRREHDPGLLSADDACPKTGFSFFRQASLPLSHALIILQAVLLILLGLLIYQVSTGVLPFSPDGQFGLLLVLTALQMMTIGETPVGQFKRSWLMILLGIGFTALGVFSCIVPGILTGVIQMFLGLLNVIGGTALLVMRFLPMLHRRSSRDAQAPDVPAMIKKVLIIQPMINIVVIVFGLSMLLPGLIPGRASAGILVIFGLLLFVLVYILIKVDQIAQRQRREGRLAARPAE
ncbi:MAG: hypothetical protein AB9866_26360 [Syntrophobacteraceae bacterium]